MVAHRDFTRGGQITIHALRMTMQAWRYVFGFSFGCFLVCLFLYWFEFSSPYDRNFLQQYAAAKVRLIQNFENRSVWFEYKDFHGKSFKTSAKDFVSRYRNRQHLDHCMQIAVKSLVFSFGTAVLSFLLIVFYFSKSGIQQRSSKVLKGSAAITPEELNSLVRRKKKSSDLHIGSASLIKDSETQHILLCGATGTGKSVAMLELMDQIRERKQKAIIYDIDGSFLSLYYRPEQDVLLNPLDSRGMPWNIWQEGCTEQDLEAMAASLIADGGHDPFWSNAARMVFSAAAKQLAQQDKKTNAALVEFLMTAPLEELAALLEGTKAATLVEGAIEKTTLSIRATLTSYCGALSLLGSPIIRARVGLFEKKEKHQKAKAALEGYLNSSQSGRIVGEAYSGTDGFFDAIAQQLAGKTHKALRMLCHEVAKEATEGKGEWSWFRALVEKEGSSWQDYCTTCQYTSDEVEGLVQENLLKGTAISGRPHIEGRVICQKLSIQLHVIEVMEAEEKAVFNHQLVDDTASKALDGEFVNKIYSDPKVVHLAVYQGSLHVVPLINLVKKEEVTEASDSSKEEENLFSIRKWIEKPDDSWLFICSNQRSLQSLRPLMSAWLDSTARALLSLPPSFERRVWLFMDEFTSLHRLPSMESLVTRGRKYGACVIAALQNIHQVHEVYGRNEAMSLLSNFNTMVLYRVKCPDTARWMSRVTGDYERVEQKEGYSYGANEIRDGVSIHEERRKEPVVSETQFLSLNDLSAYLILCGHWPIVRLEFKPKKRVAQYPALMSKEVVLEEKPHEQEAHPHQQVNSMHTSTFVPNDVHSEERLEEKNSIVVIASKEVLEDKPVIEGQVLEDAEKQNSSKSSHKRGRPRKNIEPKSAEQRLEGLE